MISGTLLKTNITLKMLVDAKILSIGSKLICDRNDIYGILNNDASITIYKDQGEKKFDHLSGAARYIENKSLNGWKYWSVIINGEKQLLDVLREKYLGK